MRRTLLTSLIFLVGISTAAVAGNPANAAGQISALRFEPNVGQFGKTKAKFVARAGMPIAALQVGGIELAVPGSSRTVRLEFAGANRKATLEGVEALRTRVNYFRGKRSDWHIGVPTFAQVRYHNLYPGIDLLVHAAAGGRGLEYDFEVAANANPDRIRMRVAGAAPRVDEKTGDLLLGGGRTALRQRRPVVRQRIGNQDHVIAARYVLTSSSAVTIALDDYRHDLPLVIDPAIVYSTALNGNTGVCNPYQGGCDASVVQTLANYTDANGHTFVYAGGMTGLWGGAGVPTTDFPIKGAFDSSSGLGFIAKLDPSQSGDASAVFVTYVDATVDGFGLGGVSALCVDSSGNVYATGVTADPNFPIQYGFSATGAGFLVKISSDGSTLLYSTRFGGYLTEPKGIAVDSAGDTFVAGTVFQQFSPTLNSYGECGSNAFAVEVNTSTASLVYASCFGPASPPLQGTAADALAVGGGKIFLGGHTTDTAFPIVNGMNGNFNCPNGYCASLPFVAELDPSRSGSAQLLYSTLIGNEPGQLNALTVDSTGAVYAAGTTTDAALPTTPGAYQMVPGSPTVFPEGGRLYAQGYIAKIDPTRASGSLLALTYLSGKEDGTSTDLTSIAIGPSGDIFVGGNTNSLDLPIKNPVVSGPNGFLESTDRGATSRTLNTANFDHVYAIAIDTSTTPRTIYLGTGAAQQTPSYVRPGLVKSTDGGLTWNGATSGLPTGAPVYALVLDGDHPQTVYAGVYAPGPFVYKSTDGGATWSVLVGQVPTSDSGAYVNALAWDNGTVYAAVGGYQGGGLYSVGASDTTWHTILSDELVDDIQVDTTTAPHGLYALMGDSYTIRASHDGGASWSVITPGYDQCRLPIQMTAMGLDRSVSPARIYVDDINSDCGAGDVVRSSDGGATWQVLDINGFGPGYADQNAAAYPAFAFDPTTSPTTIYYVSGGIFKSTDDGANWTYPLPAYPFNFGVVAVDPATTNGVAPALYTATVNPQRFGFVAEFDSALTTLQYSTAVGAPSFVMDMSGMSVDATGNIYLGGSTTSLFFPMVNAYRPLVPYSQNAFVTEIGTASVPVNPSGAVTSSATVATGTMSVTFPAVTGSTTTSAPTLTVTPLADATTANFQLSDNLGAYDISTTAVYSGSVTICVQALTVNDPTTFNNLTLIHIVNGTPVNITTSWDFSTRTACGTTSSFSPFILVKGAVGQIQDLVMAVNNLDLRKGIQTSLDAKLQNAESGYESAASHDYASVCNIMSAFVSAVQAQVGQALTSAEAAPLVSAAAQIKATVGCSQ